MWRVLLVFLGADKKFEEVLTFWLIRKMTKILSVNVAVSLL